ncbi:MAG: aldehyde ferredoxin oxidoreductase, partial [Proteobacteria bacterium]|nr:aldehyde ferredoxin oxidoreductase [Pseudomonadota bacterium]
MKEIPVRLLLRALTFKRLWNICLAVISYGISWATKRSIVWGQPAILTIEPTNVCNLECPLCVTGNGKMERRRGLMNFDTFRKTLDKIGDHLVYLLLYHQGEPFLNREFLR